MGILGNPPKTKSDWLAYSTLCCLKSLFSYPNPYALPFSLLLIFAQIFFGIKARKTNFIPLEKPSSTLFTKIWLACQNSIPLSISISVYSCILYLCIHPKNVINKSQIHKIGNAFQYERWGWKSLISYVTHFPSAFLYIVKYGIRYVVNNGWVNEWAVSYTGYERRNNWQRPVELLKNNAHTGCNGAMHYFSIIEWPRVNQFYLYHGYHTPRHRSA